MGQMPNGKRENSPRLARTQREIKTCNRIWCSAVYSPIAHDTTCNLKIPFWGKVWNEGFKKQTIITSWQRKVFEKVTAERAVQSICGVLHSLLSLFSGGIENKGNTAQFTKKIKWQCKDDQPMEKWH